MPLQLQPSDMGMLQRHIRDAFSSKNPQHDLRAFVLPTLGFDIFDKLGGPDTALSVFATKLISKIDEDGTAETLVRELYLARKGDPQLREFVRRVLPDALTLVSEKEFETARIRSAIEGVIGLDGLRQDPDLWSSIESIKFDLEKTANNLNELAAYKGMHDALHGLQLRLYGQIAEEIARLPEDDASDALRLYMQELEEIQVKASDAASGLEDELLAEPEKQWIASLEQFRLKISAAIDAKDPAPARNAETGLRQLLRAQPPLLNRSLVHTARQIPWKKLIQTMGLVASRLNEEEAQRQPLVDAQRALESLMVEVLSRVEEHELWQRVDTSFWMTEDALKGNDQPAADEVSQLWLILAEQFCEIRKKAPGKWVADMDHFTNAFTAICPIPAKLPLDQRARGAFHRLVSSGRNRFFSVDRDLKAQCQGISKLSEPLKRLLQ